MATTATATRFLDNANGRHQQNRRLRRFIVPATLALMLVATPVADAQRSATYGLTASEILDKMSGDEQDGFFWGAIEMAMYLARTQEKNVAKADCILNWYFKPTASNPFDEIVAVFSTNKNLPAIALLQVVINRHCGPK